jgi:cell fate (sporulation/competence/biofilm development) regulator YlbF (YheA/YmcA/DUF963 family)
MELSDELKQAAETLGKYLSDEAGVREYLNLKAQTQADEELASLENQFNQLYQQLATRQEKGEELSRSELDEYYRMRETLRNNPLLSGCEMQLEGVRALFGKVSQQLNAVLGVDYTAMTR